MNLYLEKASQVLHMVALQFATIKEADEFYKALETNQPVTIKLLESKTQ